MCSNGSVTSWLRCWMCRESAGPRTSTVGSRRSLERSSKRKRKKRRKRRLPRTSSLLSPRRRLRQWLLQGWFSWFRSYAVSPSFFGRPKLLGFMDGMDQNGSCSGVCKVGIAGGSAPRAVFSSLVGKSMMLGIMALTDQKDSCDMVRQRIQFLRQCAYVFSAMLASSVATYFASVCVHIQRNAWFGSGYMVCVTLVFPQSPWYLTDTCSAFASGVQNYGFFWEVASWFISVFSSSWFNTGYMFTLLYVGLWFRLQKLRSLHSCSFFSCWSSTSPSWRRGRFPLVQ